MTTIALPELLFRQANKFLSALNLEIVLLQGTQEKMCYLGFIHELLFRQVNKLLSSLNLEIALLQGTHEKMCYLGFIHELLFRLIIFKFGNCSSAKYP